MTCRLLLARALALSTSLPSLSISTKQTARCIGRSSGAKRTLDTLMNTNNDSNGIPLSSFDDMDKSTKTTATKVQKVHRDSDSEEAILFERSVQVTYEEASKDHRPGMQAHQPKVRTGNRI